MAAPKTVDDVKVWFERDLSRYASWANNVEIMEGSEPDRFDARFYTDIHSFHISARNPRDGDDGYLGCIAGCRKPRAGEDWTRGNDLADGPLSEQTWHRILGDIISYELVKVHRPKLGEPDQGRLSVASAEPTSGALAA